MRSLHVLTGTRVLELAALAMLAATATSAWARQPVENGQIVFRRYLDVGRTTGAIFTANPNGTRVRQVTRPARGVIDQYPDLSPDGNTIVFHRMVPCPAGGSRDGMDGTCDLVYTVRRDGSGLKPLVPCAFDARKPFPGSCVGVHTPAWSPDGSKIAFSYSLVREEYDDALDLNRAIWIANVDGSGRRQVTSLTPTASGTTSPSGRRTGRSSCSRASTYSGSEMPSSPSTSRATTSFS